MAVGLVVVGGAGAMYLRGPAAPEVDPQLRAEAATVIRVHLEGGERNGVLTVPDYAKLESAVFCEVRVIEARPRGADLRVGVHAACEELGLRNGGLLTGTASWTPLVITLRGPQGARRVVATAHPDDGGASYATGIERMFSKAGAAELRRVEEDDVPDSTKRLQARARKAFGLPADAPVRQS